MDCVVAVGYGVMGSVGDHRQGFFVAAVSGLLTTVATCGRDAVIVEVVSAVDQFVYIGMATMLGACWAGCVVHHIGVNDTVCVLPSVFLSVSFILNR